MSSIQKWFFSFKDWGSNYVQTISLLHLFQFSYIGVADDHLLQQQVSATLIGANQDILKYKIHESKFPFESLSAWIKFALKL